MDSPFIPFFLPGDGYNRGHRWKAYIFPHGVDEYHAGSLTWCHTLCDTDDPDYGYYCRRDYYIRRDGSARIVSDTRDTRDGHEDAETILAPGSFFATVHGSFGGGGGNIIHRFGTHPGYAAIISAALAEGRDPLPEMNSLLRRIIDAEIEASLADE